MIAGSAVSGLRLSVARSRFPLPTISFLLFALVALGLAAHPSAAQTATPSPATYNFASIPVGSAASPTTITFTFTAGGTIAPPAVLTQGAPNLDFTDAGTGTCSTNGTSHAYSVGDTCTVDVNFSPKLVGNRQGAVVLTDVSAYLQGAGSGPQAAFYTGQAQSLGDFAFFTKAVTADSSGNIFYVTDPGSVWERLASGARIWLNNDTLPLFLGSIAVDGAGNLFLAGGSPSGDPSPTLIELLAAWGYQKAVVLLDQNYHPIAVAVDSAGNVYFTDAWSTFAGPTGIKELLEVDGYATLKTIFPASAGEDIGDLAVDGSGNIFFSDYPDSQNRWAVKELTASSIHTQVVTVADGNYGEPALAVDGSGNLFYGASQASGPGQIMEIPAAGGNTMLIAPFGAPGIAVGGNEEVFLTDGDLFIYEVNLGAPPSLTFAKVHGGNTSKDSPQTFTVRNIGNQPLQISGLTYPTDFPEAPGVGTDCTLSTSLDAGSACTLSIDFFPLYASATGEFTLLHESVSLTDNDRNAPGTVHSVPVSGTEHVSVVPPAIISPAPGSALAGSAVTFSWTPGIGISAYWLAVGSTKGGSDYCCNAQTTATSAVVAGLPVNGAVVYARLYYQMQDGSWNYADYHYAALQAPSFTAPQPGSTLGGSSATFSWNPGGFTTFRLLLGTMEGADDIYNGVPTTATSVTLNNLPEYGGTIYAKLYYYNGYLTAGLVRNTWVEPGVPVPASLTSPAPGSTLTGPSATFTWDPGHGASLFRLFLGSRPGAYDLFLSPQTHQNSVVAYGIPATAGTTVYASLYFQVSGRWYTRGYTYNTASSAPTVNPKFVQSASFTTTTSASLDTYSAAFANPVTTGDMIALAFFWGSPPGGSIVSVTDSAGNAYVPAIQTSSTDSNGSAGWIYVSPHATGGSNLSVTVRVSASTADLFSMALLEYSGLGSLDVTSTASGTATPVFSSGFATTNHSNEVILGLVVSNGCAAAPGFYLRFAREGFCVEDKFVTDAGSYDTEFTPTAIVPLERWYAAMAAFY